MSVLLRNITGPIAIALLFLAAAALAPAFGVGLGANWIRSGTELPICDVGSFAVDLQGNVYLQIGTYNQIQKYDSSGRFVTHWPVPTGTGTFSLRVGAHETIDALAWRSKRIYRYAPDGTIVATETVNEQNQSAFRGTSATIATPEGVTYRLSSPNWWPTVHRAGPGSPEQVLVSTRVAMWLFSVPFPALGFAAVGIGLLGIFLSSGRRQQSAAQQLASTSCN